MRGTASPPEKTVRWVARRLGYRLMRSAKPKHETAVREALAGYRLVDLREKNPEKKIVLGTFWNARLADVWEFLTRSTGEEGRP